MQCMLEKVKRYDPPNALTVFLAALTETAHQLTLHAKAATAYRHCCSFQFFLFVRATGISFDAESES